MKNFKKHNINPEEAAIMRQKAEEQLKLRADVARNVSTPATEPDMLKLIHELQVHQIELELQNEELVIAREKAELAEDKFTSLFDFAPTAYFNLTPEGYISELNLAGAKILGKDRSKLVNSRFDLFISSNTRVVFDDFFSQVIMGKSPASCEVAFATGSDSTTYALLSGTVADDDKHCMITATDITGRKQAEEHIRFLAHITANSPVITAYHDKDLNMVWANKAYEKATGLSLEEIKGRKCYQVWNLSKPCQSCPVLTAIETGVDASHELTPDNQEHWPEAQGYWLSQATPVRDAEGTIIGAIEFALNITENKKVEKELRKSDERFRIAQDMSPDGFTILQPVRDAQNRVIDFTWIYENEAIARFNGTDPQKVVGQRLLDLFPGHRDTQFFKAYQQVAESGMSITFEEGYAGESMQKKTWFRIVAVPMAENIAVLAQDITERKVTEYELRKLSRIVEQSPSSVIVTGLDGTIEYVNPKTLAITGYSKEELISKNPRIFNSGEKPKEEYKQLWSEILSGSEWTGEFHNKKKNGKLYWESASISPIFNEKQEIINFVAVKEDITERKRLELAQKLVLEISHLSTKHITLFDFLQEVHQKIKQIILADNFYVALYNETDHTFSFPYHVDEYDNLELNKAYDFRNSYTDHVLKTNQSLIVTPENQHAVEKDGSTKEYGDQLSVWLGVPFKTTEGSKPNGVIAIQDYQNRDSYTETDKSIMEIIAHSIGSFIERIKYIEDLVQARKKAEESDKLKTAFINNISHEIRTPLNGILGFGQFLIEPDLSEEERRGFFEHVEKSGNRLMNTVTDYMDMAMLFSHTLEVTKKDFALEAVFGRITDKTKKLCEEKNIEFKLEIPKEALGLTVNSDPEFIQKILDKLLENAIKFTKAGSIICGCQIKTGHLSLFVKDTGSGIDEGKLDLIFEVFKQADTAITRGHEGSGLGLTIAKGLVKLLGGEIAVASEKGKGSVFSFTIPLKNSGKSISSGATDTTKPKNTKKPLILIAEDDESNYDYLAIVIGKSGYNHIHAANGKEAVDFCRQNPDISIVLMDIKMPLMNGDEATKQIRVFRPELPIIATTAHAQTGDEYKLLAAGCNEYIAKPFKKERLLSLIRQYVE
jgi:PAS domain S-box-containing protein